MSIRGFQVKRHILKLQKKIISAQKPQKHRSYVILKLGHLVDLKICQNLKPVKNDMYHRYVK